MSAQAKGMARAFQDTQQALISKLLSDQGDLDDLVTIAEAAESILLSRQQILHLCAAGRIPVARKIGERWLLPVAQKFEILPTRGSPDDGDDDCRPIEIPRAGWGPPPRRRPPPRPSRPIEIPRKGSRKTR